MGLTAQIDATISIDMAGSPDFGVSAFKYPGWPIVQLDNGVAANQADRMYTKTITLAASSNQDIDLSGTLADAIGGSAVFAKVKAIAIKARAANTNNVVVGGAASNQFIGPFGAGTHTVAIPPGGSFCISAPGAGWTVTAATADLLRVANSAGGTPVTLDLVIVGTSA